MIRPARPLALKGLLGDVIKELRAADLGRKKERRKDGRTERANAERIREVLICALGTIARKES